MMGKEKKRGYFLFTAITLALCPVECRECSSDGCAVHARLAPSVGYWTDELEEREVEKSRPFLCFQQAAGVVMIW
jgi:hypothetical protein